MVRQSISAKNIKAAARKTAKAAAAVENAKIKPTGSRNVSDPARRNKNVEIIEGQACDKLRNCEKPGCKVSPIVGFNHCPIHPPPLTKISDIEIPEGGLTNLDAVVKFLSDLIHCTINGGDYYNRAAGIANLCKQLITAIKERNDASPEGQQRALNKAAALAALVKGITTQEAKRILLENDFASLETPQQEQLEGEEDANVTGRRRASNGQGIGETRIRRQERAEPNPAATQASQPNTGTTQQRTTNQANETGAVNGSQPSGNGADANSAADERPAVRRPRRAIGTITESDAPLVAGAASASFGAADTLTNGAKAGKVRGADYSWLD